MENNKQLEDFVDAFAELMKGLSQPTVKMINPKRYCEMMEAARNLEDLLAAECNAGKIEVHLDDVFLLGGVSVALDDFSVSNMPQFLRVLTKADCFEVYPLADGSVRVDLTFQGVLNAVG